jgi:hypothetical protein
VSSSSCAVAAEDFPWDLGGVGVIDLRDQAEVPSARKSCRRHDSQFQARI